MFKVFRNYEDEEEDQMNEEDLDIHEEYSLNDLVRRGEEFTRDKIFKSCFDLSIQHRNLTNSSENVDIFSYFQFNLTKLSQTESSNRPNVVIEVKDVSGKLLYGEAQAKK